MQITVFLVVTALMTVRCHREHKVHNIVLYPDKQSWCKTTPIKQVVGEPGYESTTVENSVCVGTCFSYSIPHTSDITITPYCDSCQPSETHWFHITLAKLANADEELSEYPNQDVSTPLPDTIQKQIQIITNCTCLSCTEQLNNQKNFLHENTSELPKNLLANNHDRKSSPHIDTKIWDEINKINSNDDADNSIGDIDAINTNVDENIKSTNVPPFEIPELLQLVNRTKSGNASRHSKSQTNDFQNVTDAQRYYLNTKLINLLKSIQSNSEQDDSIPTENNFNYDKELLSELLNIIEGSENRLSDKNLMEFVNFVNVHNSDDFELDLSRLKTILTKYEHEKKITELKNKHRQFGLCNDHSSVSNAIEYETIKSSGDSKDDHAKKHYHHYTGEHINLALDPEDPKHHLIAGHLVAGPHGSLIVQPDHVDEKINIDSNLMRPNHEGTIIHYESDDDIKNDSNNKDD